MHKLWVQTQIPERHTLLWWVRDVEENVCRVVGHRVCDRAWVLVENVRRAGPGRRLKPPGGRGHGRPRCPRSQEHGGPTAGGQSWDEWVRAKPFATRTVTFPFRATDTRKLFGMGDWAKADIATAAWLFPTTRGLGACPCLPLRGPGSHRHCSVPRVCPTLRDLTGKEG